MLVDGGTWDIQFWAACKNLQRDIKTAGRGGGLKEFSPGGGVSIALLPSPPFVENQRVKFETSREIKLVTTVGDNVCQSNSEDFTGILRQFVAHFPPMKTLSAACLIYALLFCSPCKGAEYVNLIVPPYSGEGPLLTYSQTITLAAGDMAEVILSTYSDQLEFQIGTDTFSVPPAITTQSRQPKIAGPAILRTRRDNLSATATLTVVAVTRANSPANVIPANAVVIPEDAGGQYQVILESSTDLLNWAVANPGTYGGSTAKRFFRTRIVKLN